MEQETFINPQNQTKKIYKDKEVFAGTLIGGTMVSGYMIAENYKALGEAGKVWRTWAATGLVTAAAFFIAFYAPYIDRLPRFILPVVCASAAGLLMQVCQGERVRAHLRAGGRIQSWWRTIGVSLVGMLVTMALIFGISFALAVVDESNLVSKNYGKAQHQVFYSISNITEGEVDQIAEAAMQTNLLLDSAGTWTAYVRKVNNDYEISLAVSDQTFSDAAFLKFIREERSYMQARFPNNRIVINLVGDDFSRIEKRFE